MPPFLLWPAFGLNPEKMGNVAYAVLALLSIVFLMPHMETIASLVVIVACAAAIAGNLQTERVKKRVRRF